MPVRDIATWESLGAAAPRGGTGGADAGPPARALLFEDAFEHSPMGMVITDREGTLRRANPTFARMLGFPDPGALAGESFSALTHPDDVAESLAALRRLVATGEPHRTEKRYVRRDGHIVHVLLTVTAVRDADGEVASFFTVAQDITERKAAEGERAQLAAVVGASASAIMSLDSDGVIKTWNAGAERLYGYTRAEAVGQLAARLLASDPSARDACLARVVSSRAVERFEGIDVRSDGSFVDVAVTDSPIVDSDGRVVGVARIADDITARRRAELAIRASAERWHALLAQVDEMVVLVDGDHRITYASPAVERLLHYDPGALVGQELSASHPEDTEQLTRALEQATPGRPVALRRRVIDGDGSWHWLDSRVVRLDDVLAESILIVSRDVTERLALERERERLDLDRRVSQRLEAVGQLAAGIAHEINTPLQFVGDSITFLEDAVNDLLDLIGLYRETLHNPLAVPVDQRRSRMQEAETETEVEYLVEEIPRAFTRAAEGIRRVRTIVHAMKRFSHASATEVAPADLREAIETTLEVCRNEYKYIADVTTDLGDLPLVTCNIAELNQVFLNLIINSAQAIAEKVGDSGRRGEITICTRLEDRHAVIVLADNGPGIPEEIQDRIYEPFFTTKEVGKGTGQGLALARATIDRHGGTLDCVSRTGEGATFTIRLPVLGNATNPGDEARA